MSVSSDYWCDLTLDDDEQHNILAASLSSQNKSQLCTGEQHAGFDNNVGDTWLYPSNLPLRAYQLSIVKVSLFNNTLVVLPTGLGKTFLAAVVMYNIYRWYPTSKIIFMAPTRPLVAQQIKACQRVMPFADEDTVELTGRLPRCRRKELWSEKRVFFATPQVVQSDINGVDESSTRRKDLNFPFDQVKLIVVDEAHRAKGRYAYIEVVQAIKQRNNYFRVLALSATPGRTIEDVAEVVYNLLISHIEVRCDTSVDVLPYVHKRHMKKVVVPLGEDLKALRDEVLLIIDPYLRQLVDAKVLGGSLANITRNFLLFEQKRFREQSRSKQHPEQKAVSINFSFCISMYHALELLERHGMRVFLNYFEEDEEGRNKFVVYMEPRIRHLLDRLRDKLGPNPFEFSTHPMTNGQIAKLPDNLDFGHPKFEEARICLLEHFQAHPDSRAIVFCEYRESVMLIYRLLLQHVPLLKPRYFVGQGATTGSLRPLTQKEQIQIMQDFRSGKNNILVATSIGEEGIDVGEVELIVCFDINTSNPQRFVQRIGRTGRQKQGNVVILVTEGREQQILKSVLEQKDQTNAKILQSMVVRNSLYKNSPRLVPTELDPKVIHVFIKPVPNEKGIDVKCKNDNERKTRKIKQKTKDNYSKKNQDLRTYFKQQSTQNPSLLLASPPPPDLETQQSVEKCLNKIDEYFKAFEAPVTTNTQLCASNPFTQKPPITQFNRNVILNSQRFRNLHKLMQKNTPLLRAKDVITDPVEQIKSPKVSNDGKRFILRAQPSIVSDSLEKMKVLELLASEHDEMSAEEKHVRELYSIIEKLLGGTRLAVEIFVDDAEIEEMVKKRCEIPSSVLDVSASEYNETCDAIFNGLEPQGILCDNFEFIQKEIEKIEFYKAPYLEPVEDNNIPIPYSPLKNDAESMIYETVRENYQNTNISDITMDSETIFQSNCHWGDFAKNAPLASKSTPLQGPLVKAFQRQVGKSEEKNHSKGGSLLKRLEKSFSGSNESAEDDLDVIFVSETEDLTNTKALLTDRVLEEVSTYTGEISVPDTLSDEKPVVDTQNSSKQTLPSTNSYLCELDVDIEAFLEPFPEETQKDNTAETAIVFTKKIKIDNERISLGRSANIKLAHRASQKENENTSNLIKTLKAVKKFSNPSATSAKPNLSESNSNISAIPQVKLPIQTEQYEKSPNMLEMYVENAAAKSCNEENSLIPHNTSKSKSFSFSGLDMKANEGSEMECDEFKETQILNDCKTVQSKVCKIVSLCNEDIVSNSKQKIDDDEIPNPNSPLYSSQNECNSTSNLLTTLSNTSSMLNNKHNLTVLDSNRPETPPGKLLTEPEHCQRSPNLYEMYLQNVRKRSNLPEHIKQSVTFAKNQLLKALSSSVANNVNPVQICDDDTLIIPLKAMKRKLISSSDSSEVDLKADGGLETDCEEFKDTQILNDSAFTPSKVHKRIPFGEAGIVSTSQTNFDDDIILNPTSPIHSNQKENENISTVLNSKKLIKPIQLEYHQRENRMNFSKYVYKSAENQLFRALPSSDANHINSVCNEEKSLIISSKTSKRKIISSSDSSESIKAETECKETQIPMRIIDSNSSAKDSETDPSNTRNNISSCETDGEEIAETQKPIRRRRLQRQSRRLHDFVDTQAIFSRDDESEEYSQMPCSQYVKDSMIVSSDEAETFDENAATSTQMQAYYLQSVKSPKHLPRGAFKIPAFREFNDQSQIYSQAAPLEESQYVCDSFVVNEDDEGSIELHDQTVCPLERAERILKERRRRSKEFKSVAKIQRRRRIVKPAESSEDED
ncbi:uncharacterized protein LOC128868344 isoform X1 [Anastrepha ludens]|uniref:uncharacterized protein LOC128868344 isoform X1 n=1 Tax=Anastrepha ludens TaxID=28586 RepID=UPI0023B17BA2|nr:uncharacterized protein LOC128868344 isoform X1 [Anastrepha ludens]